MSAMISSVEKISPGALTPVRMFSLPAGEFVMGARRGDKFANSTERPAVLVQIDAFAIGRWPVTVGEWRTFQPEHAPDDADELPVVDVSWNDACNFCEWLAEKSSARYRLPRETEWEYACRAGSDTPFHSGAMLSSEDANFYYDESGARVGRGARTPVGAFPANAFGLHDMHGNVCEWCADAWHTSHDHARRETVRSPMRVIRGGAWDYLPRLLRSSWRDGLPPHTRRDNLGFRIALTLPN